MITAFNSDRYFKKLVCTQEVIDLSKFVRLPGGGTHDIYRLSENAPFLVKIMQRSIGQDVEQLETICEDLNNKYRKLYDIFDESRCLVEKRYVKQIKLHDSDQHQYAIISLVAFDDCFQSTEKFGFITQSIEMNECLIQKYNDKFHIMNHSLLGASQAPVDIENFLLFQSSFRPIFTLLDTDVSLQIAMKEFLEKYRNYYKNTNELMDNTGIDNVLFYKKEDTWHYKIGSVIKNVTGTMINEMIKNIAQKPEMVQETFESHWAPIFFAITWLRALNATAAKLGMERIIDNVIISSQDSHNLANIHLTQPWNERAIAHAEYGAFTTALEYFNKHKETEKEHNTRCRDILGTCYYKHLQNSTSLPPQQEIQAFFALLADTNNHFPEARKAETSEAIQGLNSILQKYDLPSLLVTLNKALQRFESLPEQERTNNITPLIYSSNTDASIYLGESPGECQKNDQRKNGLK